MKRFDMFLRAEESALNRKDHTNPRHYVAMIAAMKMAATKHLKPGQMASLAVHKLTNQELIAALKEPAIAYAELGSSDQAATGPELLKKLHAELAN